jgi:hypothetical protein
MNRRAYQLENDITSTLPTAGEDFMFPQEYLMGWAVAEVQCLIYPGDANVFAGYAKHRNLRDDFCRAGEITKWSSMPPVNAIRDRPLLCSAVIVVATVYYHRHRQPSAANT